LRSTFETKETKSGGSLFIYFSDTWSYDITAELKLNRTQSFLCLSLVSTILYLRH